MATTPIGGAAVLFQATGVGQVTAAQQQLKQGQLALAGGSRGVASALAAESRGWESTSVRRAAVRTSFALLSGSVQGTASNLAQMLAIMSPVGGAFGGLALALGVELLPALYKNITGYRAFDEVLKDVKKSADDAAESVKFFAMRRQEAIKVQELGERGDFGQINKQRQEFVKQIEQSKSDIAKLQQLNEDNLHAGAARAVPHLPGQTVNDLIATYWSLAGSPLADKNNRFDLNGLQAELGRQDAVKRGVRDPNQITDDELRKVYGWNPQGRQTPLQRDQAVQHLMRLEGAKVMDAPGWSPRSVDTHTLLRFMGTEERGELLKNSGSDDIIKQRKLLADAKRNLAELNKKEIPALDEDLLADANPREYRRFQIRREAGQRHQFLRDRGVADNDPRSKLVDKIMQRQLDLVDRGGGGIVDAAKVHDTIQNSILKDDAGRTAIACEQIVKELQEMNRGDKKLVAEPQKTVLAP
jgi:hypothetical protein